MPSTPSSIWDPGDPKNWAPRTEAYKSFQLAVECNDPLQVEAAIAVGIDVNKLFVEDGDIEGPGSALHIASAAGYVEIMHILLAAGAYVNMYNYGNDEWSYGHETPFWFAARNNEVAALEILLEHHADVDCIGHYGGTPLNFVLYNRQEESESTAEKLWSVVTLLNYGADVNHVSPAEGSVLQQAVESNRMVLIDMLLRRGAIVDDAIMERAQSMVNYAHTKRIAGWQDYSAQIMELLQRSRSLQTVHKSPRVFIGEILLLAHLEDHLGGIARPQNVNTQKEGSITASLRRKLSKLDVAAVDANGLSPLLAVCANEATPNIVNILLELGADVNAKSTNVEGSQLAWNETPLHKCVIGCEVATFQLLLEKGAYTDLESRNSYGQTPLLKLASFGFCMCHTCKKQGESEEIPTLRKLRWLIMLGANLNATDQNGDTALHLLAKNTTSEQTKRDIRWRRRERSPYRLKAVELLLLAGISVTVRNNEGFTAQDILSEGDDDEMLTLLQHFQARNVAGPVENRSDLMDLEV